MAERDGDGEREGRGGAAAPLPLRAETGESLSDANDAAARGRSEPSSPGPSFERLKPHVRAKQDLIRLHRWNASAERDGKTKQLGKTPLTVGWRTATPLTEKQAEAHMAAGKNIGVRLRATDLVIDIDPRNDGDESFERLQCDLGVRLDCGPTVRTGSGGRHVYMTKPAGLRTRASLPEYGGIDFKKFGGYVVASGSAHPDKGCLYEVDDPLGLDEMGAPPSAPTALLALIEIPAPGARQPSEVDGPTLTPDEMESVLALVDARTYNKKHDPWLEFSMACHAVTGGTAEAEWLAWCTSDPAYAGEELDLSRRWASFDARHPGGVGMGTLRMHLREFPEADAKLSELLRPDPAECFADDLPQESPTHENRRTIVVRAGKLSSIIDEAQAALILAGEPIYRRGMGLVRTVTIEDTDPFEDGIKRKRGSLALLEVKKLWLRERMAQSATWKKRAPGRSGADGPSLVTADPPPMIAEHLLDRGEWDFPAVRAIARAPTITRDGRLLQQPGYDPHSALILDLRPDEFPPVPERPSREDAETALDALRRPLRGFPFVDDDARAVALSAILTGLVRPALDAAPLHAFDAPTAGTGKSLLTDIIGIVVSGVAPAAMSMAQGEEELEKRLASSLIAGDQVILIDNAKRALEGDLLCSMLTQARVKTRILGRSEAVELPSACLVLATGNNLSFAKDVGRRALVCRLDAGMDRPDLREFDFNAREEAKRDRAKLVSAALTVIAAYQAAGQPLKGRLRPVGSFEEWSPLVRDALAWLGAGDAASTIDQALDSDPEIELLSELLPLWRSAYGDRAVMMRQVAEDADREGMDSAEGKLKALLSAHLGHGIWDARKIANGLKRWKGRMAGRLCLTSGEKGMHGVPWRVVER